MRSAPLLLALLLVIPLMSAAPQTRSTFPTPPEPLNKEQTSEPVPPPTQHVDLARVQQEADELARTAQTIPSDVTSLRKGMLPKDTIQKLKQIEKLSKRLRTELNP